MIAIYSYENNRFEDILRHVEEERRRIDPMQTLPALNHPRLFQVISAALLQVVSFIFG